MHARMPHGIENRKQNKPGGARHGKEERNDRAGLVEPALVSHQMSTVSHPALSQKSKIKRDHSNTAHRDKQGFEPPRANVGDVSIKKILARPTSNNKNTKRGDVRHMFFRRHFGIMRLPLRSPCR
jgi:hypothetical protein